MRTVRKQIALATTAGTDALDGARVRGGDPSAEE